MSWCAAISRSSGRTRSACSTAPTKGMTIDNFDLPASAFWVAFRPPILKLGFNFSGSGFEFLTKLLAQSLRHRIQVLGECETPLFRGLLCEFLELLRDRLHGFLALGCQRTRKGVFNPVLDGSQVAAYLAEPGFDFIRAACLQVLEGQSDSALDLNSPHRRRFRRRRAPGARQDPTPGGARTRSALPFSGQGPTLPTEVGTLSRRHRPGSDRSHGGEPHVSPQVAPAKKTRVFRLAALRCAPVSKACRCSFSIPARTCCCVVVVSSFDNTCARCSTACSSPARRCRNSVRAAPIFCSMAVFADPSISADCSRVCSRTRVPSVLPQALP